MFESGTVASSIGSSSPLREKWVNSISLIGQKASPLMPPQLRIYPGALNELVVRTLFDNSAAVEDDDAVHLAQRRKTVRNRYDGLLVHKLMQRFLNLDLAFAIEGARRFVE